MDKAVTIFGYELSFAQLVSYIAFLVSMPTAAIATIIALAPSAEITATALFAIVAPLAFFVVYLPRFITRNFDGDFKPVRGIAFSARF